MMRISSHAFLISQGINLLFAFCAQLVSHGDLEVEICFLLLLLIERFITLLIRSSRMLTAAISHFLKSWESFWESSPLYIRDICFLGRMGGHTQD